MRRTVQAAGKRTLLIGLLALGAWALAAMPAWGEVRPRFDKGVREAYLELDFSAEIKAATSNPPLGLGKGGHLTKYDIFPGKLTESESRLLSTHAIAQGKTLSINGVIAAISAYYGKFNELPRDGADLLALYGDLHTAEGLEAFEALPRSEQFSLASRGLNPATGKLYAQLQEEEWHPLGLYVHLVSGADGIVKLPIPFTSGGPGEEKTTEQVKSLRAWEVVVFGEAPGSVLVRKKFYSIRD